MHERFYLTHLPVRESYNGGVGSEEGGDPTI
jgi:hypothetical protein